MTCFIGIKYIIWSVLLQYCLQLSTSQDFANLRQQIHYTQFSRIFYTSDNYFLKSISCKLPAVSNTSSLRRSLDEYFRFAPYKINQKLFHQQLNQQLMDVFLFYFSFLFFSKSFLISLLFYLYIANLCSSEAYLFPEFSDT